MAAQITPFFDEATSTYSYLLADPASGACALIDPLLDYDAAAGRVGHASADRLLQAVRSRGLRLEWILETHVHADHLSAAHYLREHLGGRIGIGARVLQVQRTFAELFDLGDSFVADGRQFDALFEDGQCFTVGELQVTALHTPACLSYQVEDAVFVGDTLFMPDYGTARCDFPGGDAATLYRSIQRLFALPPATRLFLCHDYPGGERQAHAWMSSVAEQRRDNVHVHDGVCEADFVRLREARDAALKMPALLFPSVQVNIRAGALPPPAGNGVRYLKIPLDRL